MLLQMNNDWFSFEEFFEEFRMPLCDKGKDDEIPEVIAKLANKVDDVMFDEVVEEIIIKEVAW